MGRRGSTDAQRDLDLQLSLEQDVLEAGLLLHVVDGRLELFVELVALLLDVVEALLQHLVLPRQVAQLRLEDVQTALGILQRHLVLLIVGELVAQLLNLLERARQRLRELL